MNHLRQNYVCLMLKLHATGHSLRSHKIMNSWTDWSFDSQRSERFVSGNDIEQFFIDTALAQLVETAVELS